MKRLIPFLFLLALPAMAQRGGPSTARSGGSNTCLSTVASGGNCSGYENTWCVNYGTGAILSCNPATHQWATVGTSAPGPATDLTCTTCVSMASEVGTFGSSTLLATLTDETGSGLAVFGTSPTLITPNITGLTADRCLHTNNFGVVVVDSGNCTTTGGTGTVTNIATTSPITGGAITTTGTIACATCTTNAAALTASRIVLGAGSQATSVLASLGTTTTLLHGNAAGAPTFSAVDLAADVTGTLPAASVGTGLTDAQVSNTLQSSLFVGSGSTTNAIDLATAEVAGTLPNANTTAVSTSTASTLVARDASADFAAHTVTVLSLIAAGSADNTLGDKDITDSRWGDVKSFQRTALLFMNQR